MKCQSCDQKDAEIYRLSLVEARVHKLEEENAKLQEYADFDKTCAGNMWDLMKGLTTMIAAFPGLVEDSKVALEWEKLTGSRKPYEYLTTRAAEEWPVKGDDDQ